MAAVVAMARAIAAAAAATLMQLLARRAAWPSSCHVSASWQGTRDRSRHDHEGDTQGESEYSRARGRPSTREGPTRERESERQATNEQPAEDA